MEKLLLVGAGGFGRVVLEHASALYDCAFLDDGKAKVVDGVQVIGTTQELLATGNPKTQICKQIKIAIATLNSMLPYEKGVYSLSDVSNAAEDGVVSGPKQLKIYGSSYVWAIFKRFGLIHASDNWRRGD